MARVFCVRCGRPLRRARTGGRSRTPQECPNCGWIDWNNPAPTASVLILNGDRVLLVRRAVPPARGAWDVPGGFIEPGETAERAARREVREELGIAVRLERVLGTFPDVYGPERVPTLNIYFVGRLRYRGASVRAGDDAASFKWIPLRALPRLAFKNNRDALRRLRADLRAGR